MDSPLHPTLETVTTIRADGSRRFLFPADVRGPLSRARRLSGLGLIAVYLLLPWIKIGGFPAVFLDVAERRFHLFGLTLAFQDLWLLFFGITGLGFTLFFLTALFGRLWCGWACPQTVFLDHVFRRIERWIDGDALARRALEEAPWSANKIGRRILKHTLYLACAAGVVHLFLAYFVSLPKLWAMMGQAPGAHWGSFVFVGAATGALYFNFAWFREQLCIVLCPYGRLQSVLVDEHSLIIGYDPGRGEPRATAGEAKRLAEQMPPQRSGDCVACNRCVQVCPTGIDIRNGLQLECIGCAACIDACNTVMTRVGRATGLIRYDSLAGLAGRPTRWIRPRTGLYALLLLAGASVGAWALSTLHPANFGITRMTGSPYFVDRDFVRNQFLVRIVNKQAGTAHFTVRIGPTPTGLVELGHNGDVELGGQAEGIEPLILEVPRSAYRGPFPFTVILEGRGKKYQLKKTVEFLGPDQRLLREEDEERKKESHD